MQSGGERESLTSQKRTSGGLTAAALLRDLGVEVDVYERSPSELVQRGAGIGFLPSAARYLIERPASVWTGSASPPRTSGTSTGAAM